MGATTTERCDCCGRVVASDGVPCKTEGLDRFYRRRVRMWEWLTSSRWLGWRLQADDWQTICEDCWDAIGRAVSAARKALA